jgi:hypothetical protein
MDSARTGPSLIHDVFTHTRVDAEPFTTRRKDRGYAAEVGKIFSMGTRVDAFTGANPDTDPGNTRSAEQVKEVVERMKLVAAAQRAGLLDKRAGSLEKARLRREILGGPVAHLAEVGKRARRSEHELGVVFRYRPGRQTYVAFQTNVRSMQAAAKANKEVLLKYGLSEAVHARMDELLDQFDAAVLLCDNGRTAHKGATKQLDELATELASVVRTMDARNRLRSRTTGSCWSRGSAPVQCWGSSGGTQSSHPRRRREVSRVGRRERAAK